MLTKALKSKNSFLKTKKKEKLKKKKGAGSA